MDEHRPDIRDIQTEIAEIKARKARRTQVVTLAVVLTLVIALSFSVVFLARPAQVRGMSMSPTLRAGDLVLINRISIAPRHGDVVISNLLAEDGLRLIKRVIGLPGDVIDINAETGLVTRNGAVLEEAYVAAHSFAPCDIALPVQVPEGYAFVLGDNRKSSVDSRSNEVGMVPLDSLIGRVWASVRLLGEGR